jgi:hypothetical protein
VLYVVAADKNLTIFHHQNGNNSAFTAEPVFINPDF